MPRVQQKFIVGYEVLGTLNAEPDISGEHKPQIWHWHGIMHWCQQSALV
ncbi:19918_t:CDS:2 [Gigaspora rosea]|nr:19918_t:CDS:2 [Gigaspora rosea]